MTSQTRNDFWTLFFAGWIWHMLYAVTGFNDLVGLIAPVNESVWEHLKLGYGATLVILVQDAWRSSVRNQTSSVLGRAVGIIAMNIGIVVGFYTYTAFTDSSFVIVDIMLYGVACWIAVLIHERFTRNPPSAFMEYIGIALLAMIALVFAWLTINVPSSAIFHPEI